MGDDVVTLTEVGSKAHGLRLHLIGDDTITGGFGGWDQIARSRRTSAAGWVGTPATTMVLPLRLDGVRAPLGTSTVIEAGIARLLAWGQAAPGAATPAVLTVDGPTRAPARSFWVVDDIEQGEQFRNDNGRRVRQDFVVTLLRFEAPDLVVSHAKRSRDHHKGNGAKDGKDDGKGKGKK